MKPNRNKLSHLLARKQHGSALCAALTAERFAYNSPKAAS
jgi:hypothetical protein